MLSKPLLIGIGVVGLFVVVGIIIVVVVVQGRSGQQVTYDENGDTGRAVAHFEVLRYADDFCRSSQTWLGNGVKNKKLPSSQCNESRTTDGIYRHFS